MRSSYISYKEAEPEESLTKLAHYNNLPRIVSMLDSNPSRVDEQDNKGRTALYIAMQNANLKLVKLLLKQGANMDIKTNKGKTVLQTAVSGSCIEIVERLLANDSSKINARDDKGSTLLHCASQRNFSRMVALLLLSGAATDLQDQEGRTALHLAASATDGSEQVIQLLSHEAIIDKRDNQGRTPLHYAVTSSNNRENMQSTIQLLLENGAYSSLSNEEKKNCTENKLQDSAVALALQMYWEKPIAKILENESFYTTLLLTGFRPQRITLPDSLQRVQDHIEDTIVEWINIKTLSISERRAMGSQVLKALPTLIELIKLKEKIVSPYLPTDYAYQDIKILKEFLFIPKKEFEQSQMKVLEALYENKSIPTEVVDLIQQSRVLGVFLC